MRTRKKTCPDIRDMFLDPNSRLMCCCLQDLAHLAPEVLTEMAAACRLMHIDPLTTVFVEGAAPDWQYTVVTGDVQVRSHRCTQHTACHRRSHTSVL